MDIKLRLVQLKITLERHGAMSQWTQTVTDALAELEALQKDALRYRWLRNEARWPASAEAGTTAGVQLDGLCDSHVR